MIRLSVPYRKQQFENSCLPACIRMVLRYYGDDINERKLFHQGRIKPWKGTWDVTTAQSVLKKGYAVTVGWTGDLTSWNIPLNISKRYWKEYKKAIRKGMRHEKDSTI